MLYLVLPHIDEAWWAALSQAEQRERIAAYATFGEELRTAGAFVGAYRPEPSLKAKTVRVTNGQTQVQDGPSADARKQLSGVYVVNVPDLETALSWAARNPAASYGFVEVRPIGGGSRE